MRERHSVGRNDQIAHSQYASQHALDFEELVALVRTIGTGCFDQKVLLCALVTIEAAASLLVIVRIGRVMQLGCRARVGNAIIVTRPFLISSMECHSLRALAWSLDLLLMGWHLQERPVMKCKMVEILRLEART